MSADEIYFVRGSDHCIRLMQGHPSNSRRLLFACSANLRAVVETYHLFIETGDASLVQKLQAVQLPATQQEIYDLPHEIVGGYVTLWCLTEERFRSEEGLFTQRPSPARLHETWWYVVAVREGVYAPTLQGLMRGGSARLLTEALTFADAWNLASGYAQGLINPARRDGPQYGQISFRLEEEPEQESSPPSVIREAARLARHREE